MRGEPGGDILTSKTPQVDPIKWVPWVCRNRNNKNTTDYDQGWTFCARRNIQVLNAHTSNIDDKTTASHVEDAFGDNWIIPFGIPNFLLSYNGPNFVSRFFASIWGFLRLKHLTKSTYYRQTNGQTERFKNLWSVDYVITLINTSRTGTNMSNNLHIRTKNRCTDQITSPRLASFSPGTLQYWL